MLLFEDLDNDTLDCWIINDDDDGDNFNYDYDDAINCS